MTRTVEEMKSRRLAAHLQRDRARLVLVPASDAEREGFDRLWSRIKDLLGVERYTVFPNGGEWSPEGRAHRRAEGALVLAGAFGGTLDFGQAPLRSEGMQDAFVARICR